MVIRVIGVALIGIASLLLGCGSDTAPAPPPPPPAATTSDEDEIRDVLTQAGEASSAWDVDKNAALTCTKYRDQAGSLKDLVPSMDMFAAADPAAIGADEFARLLGEQFTGASEESLRAVADAVIANNEAAYTTAMLDVVKQSTSFHLDNVGNIVVNGDTATADATVTRKIGAQPPATVTEQTELVKEDGQWKVCDPDEVE